MTRIVWQLDPELEAGLTRAAERAATMYHASVPGEVCTGTTAAGARLTFDGTARRAAWLECYARLTCALTGRYLTVAPPG